MGHRPCVLPAIVMVKTIYSAAEAQRRVQEDDKVREYAQSSKDVRESIRLVF